MDTQIMNDIVTYISYDKTKEEFYRKLTQEELNFWDKVENEVKLNISNGINPDFEFEWEVLPNKIKKTEQSIKHLEEIKTKKIEAKVKRLNDRKNIRRQNATDIGQVLRDNFERQKRNTLSKHGAKKADVKKSLSIYDRERYIKEMTDDLDPVLRKAAVRAAKTVGYWDSNNATNWFRAVSDSISTAISEAIDRELAIADREDNAEEEIANTFDDYIDNKADWLAIGIATTVTVFGLMESAQANKIGTKTWVTTSQNPRPSHAELDGMTINMDEDFPNGAAYPGSPDLPEDERINCECLIDFEGI